MSAVSVSRVDLSAPLTRARALEFLDRLLGPACFYLAVTFLIFAAGVIHRLGNAGLTLFETDVILWGLLLLWPIFVLEGLLRLAACRRPGMPFTRRLSAFLGVCLFPAFRLGGRAYADPGKIWLPRLGWTGVDFRLRNRLERLISVPMIVVALMMLPLLAVEYFWLDTVRAHWGLSLLLDIGTSLVWLAFALEFIVMVSIAADHTRYCLHNWMDLAVVCLPLIDFLPILRLVRLNTREQEIAELRKEIAELEAVLTASTSPKITPAKCV
jgi:hypothetical protein